MREYGGYEPSSHAYEITGCQNLRLRRCSPSTWSSTSRALGRNLVDIGLFAVRLLEVGLLEALNGGKRVSLPIARKAPRADRTPDQVDRADQLRDDACCRMARSSWLRTSHLAPPDAPASVPTDDMSKPCWRTDLRAPAPALKVKENDFTVCGFGGNQLRYEWLL